jgi:hypothetical protein
LNNTGFTTDKTWNTYIASPLKDPATPTETVTVTPSGGSLTHTINLPAIQWPASWCNDGLGTLLNLLGKPFAYKLPAASY